MNLIDRIKKQYYKTPSISFNFKFSKSLIKFEIRIDKKDSRAFEWYLERKKLGFDERELWSLSSRLFDKFHLVNPELNNDKIDYNDKQHRINIINSYKELSKSIDKYQDIMKWFYPRMKQYIEWGCPISLYLNGRKKYLSKSYKIDRNSYIIKEDCKIYTNVCLNTLNKLINKEETTYSERRELFYILDEFGW